LRPFALVRANYEDLSKGIHKIEKYLIRFLSNLLLKEKNSLKNQELHVHYIDTVKSENDTVFSLINQNKNIIETEISKQCESRVKNSAKVQ